MGQALIQGLLSSQTLKASQIWGSASTTESCKSAEKKLGIKVTRDTHELLQKTDILLLCIKPKQTPSLISSLSKSGKLNPKTLIISVAAGVTIAQIEKELGGNQNPVIRAMPNTPCVVKQGVSVICGGTHVTEKHLKTARSIFESVGVCLDLDESLFDAATGLSGSGPAFAFLIMESLVDGGVRVGLPRSTALKLVTQTVLGSALMVRDSGKHLSALREDVTTPAGCTIGALLIMEDGKIRSVLARAVEEAAQIAKTLGTPSPNK
jgi:pyrroline-5-carboxylate reductase